MLNESTVRSTASKSNLILSFAFLDILHGTFFFSFFFSLYLFHRNSILIHSSKNIYILLFSLQGHNWLPIALMLLSLLLAGFSVTRAVTSIERVNNVMMPLLLLVLLVSFYWSLTLKYASHGITYLFTPDWGELQHSSGEKVNCVEELLGWADCATKFLGGQAACAQSIENPAGSPL